MAGPKNPNPNPDDQKKPSIDDIVNSSVKEFEELKEKWDTSLTKNLYGSKGAIAYAVDKYVGKELGSSDVSDIYTKFDGAFKNTIAKAFGIDYSSLKDTKEGGVKGTVDSLESFVFKGLDKPFFDNLLVGNKFNSDIIDKLKPEISNRLNKYVIENQYMTKISKKIKWEDKDQRESWAKYLVKNKEGEQRDILYNQLVSNSNAFYSAITNKVLTTYSQGRQ